MAKQEPSTEPRFRGRATIRDIADLAGVSIATVSRVLNDRPDVAPDTRETVLQVVRQQGFKRAARAQTPRQAKARSGSIGLTLPQVNDAYFGPMLFGASEALYEADLRTVICPTLQEHDREVSLIERLMRGGSTDGAILVLPEEREDELLTLRSQGYPFVVIDPRERPPDGIPCVAAMHASGAKQATEHLLALGHRRIAAIAGTPGWYATEQRLIGYRAALAEEGILPEPELIVYSDWQTPRGIEAAEQLLSLPEPPTAIFAFNDNVAIGVLHAAHRRGLAVPRDLSVVGFDDTALAGIVIPTLTTVRQPLAEMGRMGVSLLLRILDGQRVEALRLELSTELIVRESSAQVRTPAAVR